MGHGLIETVLDEALEDLELRRSPDRDRLDMGALGPRQPPAGEQLEGRGRARDRGLAVLLATLAFRAGRSFRVHGPGARCTAVAPRVDTTSTQPQRLSVMRDMLGPADESIAGE